jgi:hypothetical protein
MSSQRTNSETELRTVEVTDSRLSPETRAMLTEEAREVVGHDRVEVPASRAHPAEGERPLQAGSLLNLTGNRLMIKTIASMFVMVGVVALLSGSGWWFLPIAILALVALLLSIARLVLQMTSIREHASPLATAAMEADGIANPDEFFSAVVEEFTEATDDEISEHRTVSVQEDASRAGAEQRATGTQTSGRSKAVGP